MTLVELLAKLHQKHKVSSVYGIRCKVSGRVHYSNRCHYSTQNDYERKTVTITATAAQMLADKKKLCKYCSIKVATRAACISDLWLHDPLAPVEDVSFNSAEITIPVELKERCQVLSSQLRFAASYAELEQQLQQAKDELEEARFEIKQLKRQNQLLLDSSPLPDLIGTDTYAESVVDTDTWVPFL
jgi:hypothetical protein